MGDLYDAAGRGEGAATPSAPRVVESVPLAVVADERADAPAADQPEAEPLMVEETAVVEVVEVAPDAEPDAGSDAGEEGDTEGARLVALNMALNGTSREETDRYLGENFDLADRAALLDEVYATVES
jgi:hypothetical protein